MWFGHVNKTNQCLATKNFGHVKKHVKCPVPLEVVSDVNKTNQCPVSNNVFGHVQ